jgi:hypothetical protein
VKSAKYDVSGKNPSPLQNVVASNISDKKKISKYARKTGVHVPVSKLKEITVLLINEIFSEKKPKMSFIQRF